MLFLEVYCFGNSLVLISISNSNFSMFTYIGKSRHLHEADILYSASERFLSSRERSTLKVFGALVAIYEDTGFAEVWFAGVVEVFVGVGHLVEIVGRFGSFRVG